MCGRGIKLGFAFRHGFFLGKRVQSSAEVQQLPIGAGASIDLDPHVYGTHSLRRTKATLIYRRTGNLRAVQLLLGHTKIESTVRYLGIEVDDALARSMSDPLGQS